MQITILSDTKKREKSPAEDAIDKKMIQVGNKISKFANEIRKLRENLKQLRASRDKLIRR